MTERFFGAYFGPPWPSGVCDDGSPVPTPVGERCGLCDCVVFDGEQGSFIGGIDGSLVPAHRECTLRSALGGIGHLTDHDHWCLTEHDPDGGRTYRQSALEVWEWVADHGFGESQ